MTSSSAPLLLPLLLVLGQAAFGEEGPLGWASVEGGTRGGAGGEIVMVSNEATLVRHAKDDTPRILRIEGTLRLSQPVRVGSNKSLLGIGAEARLVGGGLRVVRAHNVIIRNLSISDAPDAIDIEGSRQVWIDHCDLSRCTDGLVDIKRGSDLVTISWNHFHDHRKTSLLGHSDKEDIRRMDQGRLRVTYHHNYFNRTATRHPRVRFAEPVHVFNNYYVANEYGVASLMDAGVMVEGNFFEAVERPTLTAYGDSPDPGRLVERDNHYVSSGQPQTRGQVREPGEFYAYRLQDAVSIPETVRVGAGVGKIAP